MNIKGIVSNLIPVDFLKKTDFRKTRNAGDRDPQQNPGGGDGQPPEQHRFSDQELQEALKYLRELPGIKENNLQFRIEKNGDRVTVFVEDYTGKVIRRIPDTELWMLIKKREDGTRGNLLNKAL